MSLTREDTNGEREVQGVANSRLCGLSLKEESGPENCYSS